MLCETANGDTMIVESGIGSLFAVHNRKTRRTSQKEAKNTQLHDWWRNYVVSEDYGIVNMIRRENRFKYPIGGRVWKATQK